MTHIVSPQGWHPALGASPAHGVGAFEAHLAAWVADARSGAAIDARRRRQDLAAQQADDAGLAGILVDLGERGTVVSLVAGNVQVHGTVRAVGQDFVAVCTQARSSVALVRLARLGVVRTLPGERIAGGDRTPMVDLVLDDLLAELAADRPRLQVHTTGEAIGGELRGAGRDVLVLRTDGTPPGTAYVPTAAIAAVVLA